MAKRLKNIILGLDTDTLPKQVTRCKFGITLLLVYELRQVAIVVVNEWRLQVACLAVQHNQLVYVARGVIVRFFAPQQTQLIVGVPARVARHLSEDVIVTWHPVTGIFWGGDTLAYLQSLLVAGSLVGVHKIDPLVAPSLQGGIALPCITVELALFDARPGGFGNIDSIVGAERIEDQD